VKECVPFTHGHTSLQLLNNRENGYNTSTKFVVLYSGKVSQAKRVGVVTTISAQGVKESAAAQFTVLTVNW